VTIIRAVVIGLLLAACSSKPTATASMPVGPDAPRRLCSQFGFAVGTQALASCMSKLDGLARQQAEERKQCEGIRQRALSTQGRSGGVGNTIATADADYQSCMNSRLSDSAQVLLPTGRTVTCRLIEDQIACD
jgi:hypothetical protein